MADRIKLDVVTPERLVVSAEAESAQIPGQAGYLGIVPGHAPLISALRPGTLEYVADGKTFRMAVSAGYVEVLPNKVSVLAETAEKMEEIDVQRAQTSRKRAEERLRSAAKDIEMERAMISLERAMARLQTAGKN